MEMIHSSELNSAKTQKNYKMDILLRNPEILYAEYTEEQGEKIKTNLMFNTMRTNTGEEAHLRGICNSCQLVIHTEELDNPELTINIYNTGTVLIQGNTENLQQFEDNFNNLKTNDNEDKILSSQEFNKTPEPCPSTAPAPEFPQDALQSLAVLEMQCTEFREQILSWRHDDKVEQLVDKVSARTPIKP